jgi:hypothetical protein
MEETFCEEHETQRQALLAAALVFYEVLDRAAQSGLLDALKDDENEPSEILSALPDMIGRLRDHVVANEHGAEFRLVREALVNGYPSIELFGPLNMPGEVPVATGVTPEGFKKYFHRKAVDHG